MLTYWIPPSQKTGFFGTLNDIATRTVSSPILSLVSICFLGKYYLAIRGGACIENEAGSQRMLQLFRHDPLLQRARVFTGKKGPTPMNVNLYTSPWPFIYISRMTVRDRSEPQRK
eukprot:Protomagalhaensia_wolfi_Nauph_80__1155@NODE_1681_length_1400_cov_5_520940_g1305_i0_p1_GENE_NODE_1681_length_1400_cov_5_520940_g1305_i0NODE_1681_length_1400_cov_5_520940_g1305_i0_p1_ORF_typecomplete_len115_score9_85_NODE_1681_length_1400_cov_5_520940_g1305_i010021346